MNSIDDPRDQFRKHLDETLPGGIRPGVDRNLMDLVDFTFAVAARINCYFKACSFTVSGRPRTACIKRVITYAHLQIQC